MVWEEEKKKKKWVVVVVKSINLFSSVSMTLLLPVSYLVVARFAYARYLQSFLLSPFMLYTNPNILCALVTTISLNALINALFTDPFGSTDRVLTPRRSRVGQACFFLAAFDLCMGLGIHGSREAGLQGAVFEGDERTTLCKMVMWLGLLETMVCWGRTVVRPVVDAALFGCQPEEENGWRWPWVERVVLGASFGGLWWWRLREEVEVLVTVVEVKRSMMKGIGLSDILGWWLYHLTLFAGFARIANGVTLLFKNLIFRTRVSQLDSTTRV